MENIYSYITDTIRKPLRRIQLNISYYGNDRYCPVCKKSSNRFEAFSMPPNAQRKDARCPRCWALERHRLLWLFLEKNTNLLNSDTRKTMLHVAPEAVFEARFKALIGDGYLTADLNNPNAMVKMDITDIDFPEESFDVICCSHVLEHVENDVGAMREFHRVLKSNGWAVFLVPISCDETYEDPSVTDPEERGRAFGQSDHVRAYGPDFFDRLQTAGFTVEKTGIDDLVNLDQAGLMGLTEASGDIFYCTK